MQSHRNYHLRIDSHLTLEEIRTVVEELDDGTYFRITGLPENVFDTAGSWGLNDKSHIAGTYFQRVPCDTCGFEGEPGFKSILHSFVAKPTKASKKQLVN